MGNFGDVSPVGEGVSELRIFMVLGIEYMLYNIPPFWLFFYQAAIKALKSTI